MFRLNWYRRDLLALLLLAGLIFVFLGRGLRPGYVWMPLDIVVEGWPPWQPPNHVPQIHNRLLGDVVNYIYPLKLFTAEAIRAGELPLWNPHVMGGYPLTYNTQAGLFYPLSIFYYLWPGAAAVNLTILTQLLLGALFSYFYLRLICVRRLAAITGSVIFLFNGMMIVWLEWQVVHAAMIWLPLQLYFAERMVRSLPGGGIGHGFTQIVTDSEEAGRGLTVSDNASRPANSQLPVTNYQPAFAFATLTGIALAIPWLGGHWNWTLYSSMTLGAYLVWRLLPLFWWGATRLAAGLIGLPLLIGLALSLVQVWPAVAYLAQSHRAPPPFGESLGYGLLNRGVVFMLPNFFGSPVDGNWWGHSNYNETTFYLGILPLFLSILALWLRRDGITLFYAGWGALGLLWALGTPLYGLLYVLPIFGGLLPSRAGTIVVVCGAFLSALAIDQLMTAVKDGAVKDSRRLAAITRDIMIGLLLLAVVVYPMVYRADLAELRSYFRPQLILFTILLFGGAFLLGFRLNGRLSGNLFGALALVFITADLFIFGYGYNTVSPVENLYPETAVAQFLHADPDPFRIATLPQGIVYQPNSSLMPRLDNVSGYEPGIARRYLNYMTLAEGGSPLYWERELMPFQAVGSPLLQALNLKYLLTIDDWWREESVMAASQERATELRPLLPDQPLEQLFTMPDAGLHRVDVSLIVDAGFQGEATARILTADGGLELAHATVLAAEVWGEGWRSFYFGAFPSEWGREFLLRLTATGEGISAGATAGELAFAAYYLPRPELLFEDGRTRVYLHEGYFPRAFVVPEAVVVPDETAALAALQREMGRLDRLVILELEGQSLPATIKASEEFTAVATITDYQLNRVALTAVLSEPGYVVLADNYYPGWQAAVNGEATAVYRANSIMRAVYLPAGEHEVVFSFRPLDFILGGLVSGLTLLLCCGALWYCSRNR